MSEVSLRHVITTLILHDRRRAGLALILSILNTIAESVGLLLLVPLLDAAGVTGGDMSGLGDRLADLGLPGGLGPLLSLYVVLIALRAATGWWRQMVMAELRHGAVDTMRFRLFDALARASWDFHLRQRSSDLSHSLVADIGRVQTGTMAFFDVTTRLVATVGYLVVAFRLSAAVTTVAIIALATLVGLLWPIVRRSRRIGALQSVAGRNSFARQQDAFASMKIIKAHGAEAEHIEGYRSSVLGLRETLLTHERLTATTTASLQIGSAVALAVLTWVGVAFLDTDGATLLVLLAILARLAPTASAVLSRTQMVAAMLPAYVSARRWTELAEAAREHDAAIGADDVDRPSRFDRGISTIELADVDFSYLTDRKILSGISVRLDVGTTTGLVGPSGAGKTTVADLALGLLHPSAGQVLVDGQPLTPEELPAWRQRVAYVPQETVLFHDTLRSNILWGRAGDVDRLDAIIDAAALQTLVDRLPDGLDTVVGDRGVRLSGGERQRVAIARALWREPELLVLDEATSALDSENERLVTEAIDGLHGTLTMLVIAHRRSTLEHADRIIDLGAMA